MSWRVVLLGVLALLLLASPVAIRTAFAESEGHAEPSPALSAAHPTEAASPSPAAPHIQAAKPKRRVSARRPVPDNVGGTPINFFSEFNFLRLFGIAAIPRSTVAFPGSYKPGTIVIHTKERRLYLVLGNGEALRYGIGVGREGFAWRGINIVTDKREWPSWTPPPAMLARRPDLPRHMAGGPDNPLGARAMYLGDTLYRIHGTNEYDTIGTAVSSGCIRLTNDDVIDLYSRVRIGATVIVQ